MTSGRSSGLLAVIVVLCSSPFALWVGARAAATPAKRVASAATASAAATDAATSTEGDQRSASSEAEPSGYCVSRLLSPLRELAASPEAGAANVPDTKSGVDEKAKAGLWLNRVAQAGEAARSALQGSSSTKARVSTLIATIPDPIDSGLVYHFETSLYALRAGFERSVEHPQSPLASAYFRDRSFLPWDDREVAQSQRPASESCRTVLPGMLLFRSIALEQPSVLVVLLVGETPTSGLRGAAMFNALRIASALDPISNENADGAVIKVLGPTFSGSAYSLRLALAKHAREQRLTGTARPIQIISGTASGADVPRLLRSATDEGGAGLPQMSYWTTTVPQAAADCGYLWFLRSRLGVPSEAMTDGVRELTGVATLREAGTEFGSSGQSAQQRCDLRAQLALSFPVHVSFLRDAYEELDRNDEAQGRDASIARATTLGPALREPRVPLDVEADPSPKARAALDVMLSNLLGELSRRAIRHVSIQATDVGDAIFLARKIRDIAPDVRIAFFEPDDILLHPKFRSDLLGSLVVSPYPFLGSSIFRDGSKLSHARIGFANATSQGLFNAVLAQRGVAASELFDRSFDHDDSASVPLPLWIAAIARTGLVPLDVKVPVDCSRAIYGTPAHGGGLDALCREASANATAAGKAGGAWRAFNYVRAARLPIDPELDLPRFWNFLYALLVFVFAVDRARQMHGAAGLSRARMPQRFEDGDDLSADRAIGRTKWWLYAAIRSFLFVLAFGYMGTVYLLAFIARDGLNGGPFAWFGSAAVALAQLLVLASATYFCVSAAAQFFFDYKAFAKYVGEKLVPNSWRELANGLLSGRISAHSSEEAGANASAASGPARVTLVQRWTLSLGLAPPVDRVTAARVSFAQLRMVALLTLFFAFCFTVCLLMSSLDAADFSYSALQRAVPTLTLNVLRDVPLLNGVSPAAPALLCILCVYVWSVGRMARLSLAHGISRIAPADGETDLVSTPIRYLLYPDHTPASPCDEGYTRTERDVLNAIWRPITGRYYVFACCVVIVFPILLFTLKPLSTLEGPWGGRLLGGGLGLCTALIGITLVQLIQYWVRLQRLLRRTMAHELGPAFGRLPPYAKDSIERQLSGSSDDLLRWSATARQVRKLVAQIAREPSGCTADILARLAVHSTTLQARVQTALRMNHAPDADGSEAPRLAEAVIVSAGELSRALRAIEPARDQSDRQRAQRAAEARSYASMAVGHDVAYDSRVDTPQALMGEPESGEMRSVRVGLPPPSRSDSGFAPAAHTARIPPAAPYSAEQRSADPPWQADAEVTVATVATLLIHRHVRQFRYFMSTLVTTALLLLLAVTSYPFEPYRLLLTCIWCVIGSVVFVGVWVYLQLDRNTLISHISGGTPDRVTLSGGLLLRGVVWVLIPLLSVAAAQYPALADLLYQVIAPFARTLK